MEPIVAKPILHYALYTLHLSDGQVARSNGGTPCRESNPDRQGLRHGRYALLMVEDNRSTSAHQNCKQRKWSGSRDLHPDRPLHGRRCCCYTTILAKRFNAKGARRRAATNSFAAKVRDFALSWRSHVESHHEPSPSHGDMHISYTLRANLVFLAGLAPARYSP